MEKELKYREAAELLSLPLATFYKLVKENLVPCIRYAPGIVRFNREALLKWKDERTVKPDDN